jgi:hypothetical protein
MMEFRRDFRARLISLLTVRALFYFLLILKNSFFVCLPTENNGFLCVFVWKDKNNKLLLSLVSTLFLQLIVRGNSIRAELLPQENRSYPKLGNKRIQILIHNIYTKTLEGEDICE